MSSKEPKSMEEIHKIREKIYSETERLTMHELMEFIGKEAESFKLKHNLKLKSPNNKSVQYSFPISD